jgi:hypothetical protein
MDLDELKQAWAHMQVRVDRLELAAARRQSRGALRGTWLRLWAAQAVWVALVVASAAFWSQHLDRLPLVVAGLSLHVYGVVAIVLGGLQLHALAAVDYSEPIVMLQARLAALIRLRARCSLALGLPWWFLWLPCMIVGLTALTGVEFYDPLWAWLSLAVGALGLAATVLIARLIAARTPPGRGLHRMIDELAGRGLVRAAREVDEVARFRDS